MSAPVRYAACQDDESGYLNVPMLNCNQAPSHDVQDLTATTPYRDGNSEDTNVPHAWKRVPTQKRAGDVLVLAGRRAYIPSTGGGHLARPRMR